MIYVKHPVYDLHDVPNALFLNNNIDDYTDFHFCVHFFIPVINTRRSKKHLHWLIFNKMYFLFNYNLIFLTLFKYLIFFVHIFDPNDYG